MRRTRPRRTGPHHIPAGTGTSARPRIPGGVARGAAPAVSLALTLVLTGCDRASPGTDGGNSAGAPDGEATPTPTAASGAVSPLDNPDGTGPGLAPLTSDRDLARARGLIEDLRTRSGSVRRGADYERDAFGYAWKDTVDDVPLGRNGCDTRNDLLRRDGVKVRFRDGSDCVVVSMTLHDPYTGKDVDWRKEKATEVQIDHVVPLSYGWRMGASRWPEDEREQLANDPLNLFPAGGPANSAKGDSGPAEWLPPNEPLRCAYVVRFAQVADTYELPVTPSDKRAMLAQCDG